MLRRSILHIITGSSKTVYFHIQLSEIWQKEVVSILKPAGPEHTKTVPYKEESFLKRKEAQSGCGQFSFSLIANRWQVMRVDRSTILRAWNRRGAKSPDSGAACWQLGRSRRPHDWAEHHRVRRSLCRSSPLL